MGIYKRDVPDLYTVEYKGEQIEVCNWVSVLSSATIRGFIFEENTETEIESDFVKIGALDSLESPEAVTPATAEVMRDEYGIEPEDQGIKVINPESDDVTVIAEGRL